MKISTAVTIIVVASLMVIGARQAVAIDEPAYVVIQKDEGFEVREYAPHLLAETLVGGDLEQAGNKGFRRLFGYISGDNASRTKLAMTAPVEQQRVQDQWAVSFVMPKEYTMSTLPQPPDPSVTLRLVPAQKMAVVRYSGTWSEENYLSHKSELESWIGRIGLTSTGNPIWARYNSPFTPWFLRRNEILIPVE